MNVIDLVNRLHQHRVWVNGHLMAAAATLTEEQLHAAHPIGQGSIWRSLTHLFAAEYVWLEALHGNEEAIVPGDVTGKLPGNQEGPGSITDIRDLEHKWATLEARWRDYLSSLTPEELDDLVARKSAATGQRLAVRRSDVLLHVCTHAHYTVAQVMNMLRHAGIQKLPDTMLISLARHESM